MAKRKRGESCERRAHWRRLVAAHQQSGLTVRAYCRRERLAESAFHFWKRQLKQEAASLSVAPCAFVPVAVAPSAAAVAIDLPSGATLRVSEGCSPQLLRSVLEALRC